MPAIVTNPRAAEQLRREYGVMGDRLKMTVDDVVVPVAVVSDLTAGSSGVPIVRRAYASFNQGAVVGEYTVWRLEIPPGIIGIVRRIFTRGTAASVLHVHFGASFAVVPTNAAHTQFFDGRLRGRGQYAAGQLLFDTQIPALAAPYTLIPMEVDPGLDVPVEWPFGRESVFDFIEFSVRAVNIGALISIEWDEVTMYD